MRFFDLEVIVEHAILLPLEFGTNGALLRVVVDGRPQAYNTESSSRGLYDKIAVLCLSGHGWLRLKLSRLKISAAKVGGGGFWIYI